MSLRLRRLRPLETAAWLAAAVVALPLLSVLVQALGGEARSTWRHLAATVLPEMIANTLALGAGVGAGVLMLGVGAAWVVTRHEFPLRRTFEWAMVLPLAMPAYVLAYTYTDLLQYVGPVQTALRQAFGWRRADYWFPEIRSTLGAAAMFSLALYPYVYLLARTAFLERGGAAMEVGRSLGLGPWQAFVRVSLPLARPALAAGVALALMETLADYGTVGYFGVPTFTTGLYRAWFSLGDRRAAAQLAAVLLGAVAMVLALERAARGRARFDEGGGARRAGPPPQRLSGARAALAMLACAIPLGGGFVVPALVLVRLAHADGAWAGALGRHAAQAANSLLLSGLTAAAAVLLALLIGYARRLAPGAPMRWAHRLAGLGYALPGSVIAVGVLVPVTRLDHAVAAAWQRLGGAPVGLVLTGGIAALVYACTVRFLTAAMQSTDAGLARITPSMDDAARSLGLRPAAVFARVHLPLLRGSVTTAALLVFIDMMKELPATLVMRPFNFDTLATQAHTLAADERLAEAAVPALAIVAVGLLPLVVLCRQIARRDAAHPVDG